MFISELINQPAHHGQGFNQPVLHGQGLEQRLAREREMISRLEVLCFEAVKHCSIQPPLKMGRVTSHYFIHSR
jgi:hypothetical protein